MVYACCGKRWCPKHQRSLVQKRGWMQCIFLDRNTFFGRSSHSITPNFNNETRQSGFENVRKGITFRENLSIETPGRRSAFLATKPFNYLVPSKQIYWTKIIGEGSLLTATPRADELYLACARVDLSLLDLPQLLLVHGLELVRFRYLRKGKQEFHNRGMILSSWVDQLHTDMNHIVLS